MSKKAAASAPALTADQLALITERNQILQWLTPAKERELEIRSQLAAQLFPSPVEGVNNILTADGYAVSLDHKITRKLDEAALDTVMLQLPEDCPARVPGVLVVYKPSLVLGGFRALPTDQAKIFAQALTETPGAPVLTFAKEEVQVGDEKVVAGSDAHRDASMELKRHQEAQEKECQKLLARRAKIKKAAAKPAKKKGRK